MLAKSTASTYTLQEKIFKAVRDTDKIADTFGLYCALTLFTSCLVGNDRAFFDGVCHECESKING